MAVSKAIWSGLLITLAGCAGDRPLIDNQIDASTGITHWQPKDPIVFEHLQPELAATGSDLLYVAPVAVSRQGVVRQYLWLAFGSTIDRKLTGAAAVTQEHVYLSVADQPMRLDLKPWEEVSKVKPFDLEIPIDQVFATRLSASQMLQIAEEPLLEITVVDANAKVRTFKSRESLSEIMNAARQSGPYRSQN